MSDEKNPEQIDVGKRTAEESELATEANASPYADEARPVEHRGFRGGQSVAGYHGTGQLGSEDVGENDNAPAEED